MPARRTPSKKRRKQSSTLRDFFPVERTIKRESDDSKEKLFEIGQLVLSDICVEGSSLPKKEIGAAGSKQQRRTRWSTLKEFYPVRRSSRRPESEIKKEKQQEVAETVLSEEEKGLEVSHFAGKGRGVIATKAFLRGDFVVEYRGDLVRLAEAKRREAIYQEDPSVGCYTYFFQHKNQSYAVDATAETKYLGRLVNHSVKDPNCVTRVIEVNNVPHLILVAARDIAVGEELLYDYGDRSREAVEANPWLKQT